VTREEVKAAMAELDLVDGVEQGRLDVNVLKGVGDNGGRRLGRWRP
jgi:hypothetical protein